MHLTAYDWFKKQNLTPFKFQEEAWKAVAHKKSGLVNAPTGSGKTYSLALPLIEAAAKAQATGLFGIWITPIRALSKDILLAIQKAALEMAPSLTIEARTGDTSAAVKKRQKERLPNILITTPESLHLLMAQKDASRIFKDLRMVVVDEWHELIGSKRGVQTELALAWLRNFNREMQVWGISATIGNLNEAIEVLLGPNKRDYSLIKANHSKKIRVETILPDTMDELPWAGHLGIRLIEKVIPILNKAKTTLLFTNTRAQTEIWYQQLLENAPELAGCIAMHHGSLSNEIRSWVEEQLHLGNLKLVVCTSSLDLGIDFRPVEQVIQVGSPKGIARFLQRAGRSGHQPGAESVIWFLPTHGLELLEVEALKLSIEEGEIESRIPLIRCFDVLCQFMQTLAVGEGFEEENLYQIIKDTYAFETVNREEWLWLLSHLSQGGKTLEAYEEFNKLVKQENNKWAITNRRAILNHKLNMGTIVSESSIAVKLSGNGSLGNLEEYFASNLKPGDVFGFAGRNLEMVQLKNNVLYCKKADTPATKIPSWQGGRMPLSSALGGTLRKKILNQHKGASKEWEMAGILLNWQEQGSTVPNEQEFLIEQLISKDGCHLFFYPFEGRLVHEGLASLLAYRISKHLPISFSMAMNDYGLELLSDQPIEAEEILSLNVFDEDNLRADLLNSMNAAEMAKRKFRDIASIAGLVSRSIPGKQVKSRHLQANSSLFFEVFKDYEPSNLLYQQSFEELLQEQYEENRMRAALRRIGNATILVKKIEKPTPFAFPIMVDRLRQSLTSETLAERVKRLEMSFVSKSPKKRHKG